MRNVAHAFAGSRRVRALRRARTQTETLQRRRPFKWLVRAGFIARAITYGVIGALALAIALGAGTMGAAPNQQGALALIARAPLGRAALVVLCAGLLAYSVWKLTQGIFGRGPEGGGDSQLMDRLASLGGGAAYLVFFALAVRVLSGSAGNASGEPEHAAAGVLGWPGGRLIVGFGGGLLIVISLYQIFDAVRGDFADEDKTHEMGTRERRLFMLLGYVGLTARALVFALVGYFLIRTAVDVDPGSAVGIDGVLARLHHQPYGPWILGFVALGLIIFAAFSLLEARYRRL